MKCSYIPYKMNTVEFIIVITFIIILYFTSTIQSLNEEVTASKACLDKSLKCNKRLMIMYDGHTSSSLEWSLKDKTCTQEIDSKDVSEGLKEYFKNFEETYRLHLPIYDEYTKEYRSPFNLFNTYSYRMFIVLEPLFSSIFQIFKLFEWYHNSNALPSF